MKPVLKATALALLALGCATGALAQTWPDKPIKVVVGFPPGGAADQTVPADASLAEMEALWQEAKTRV